MIARTTTSRRLRLTLRCLVLGAGAVGMALVLSGCVLVKGLSFNGTDGIARVSVTTTLCAAKSTVCPDAGNSMTVPANTGQILLSYLVARGSTAPVSFPASPSMR